jgi:uncharacterized peroxidase-related enzyme
MPMDNAQPVPRLTFLAEPPSTPEAEALYEGDRADTGYVMNISRLWGYQPSAQHGLADLMGQAAAAASLSFRQRAILVTAGAAAMGDSYCALAWGKRLAGDAGDAVAESVLRDVDDDLDPSERALARWARRVAGDPNGTSVDDVEALRAAGYDDAQIFAITCFVAFRVAFATVNDALGALPDRELGRDAPVAVRDAVTWGRAIAPPAQ